MKKMTALDIERSKVTEFFAGTELDAVYLTGTYKVYPDGAISVERDRPRVICATRQR
jgi:hypothetical protein